MSLCAIGIAVGVVGVLSLVKRFVLRRRFGGHARCGGHSRRGFGRGPGNSFWLRAVFARLDTTPGQEREIRSAIEAFQSRAAEAKDGLKGSRVVIAKALEGDSLDEIAIGEASVHADAAAAKVKDALTDVLRRVHEVLDPKQRERLAELIAKGPRFGWRTGNPYRDAAV